MKISNFRDYKIHGKPDSVIGRYYTATVDCETGMLWWKKRLQRQVRRNYADHWFFVDTGKFTPGFLVEESHRSFLAKTA